MGEGSDAKSEFGNLLRIAREHAGVSRQKLSKQVGLDISHIFRIEAGERHPSREAVLALADALGLSDETIGEWLLAAGFAPMPLMAAVRAAVRTRGSMRTRSAGTAELSHWDPAVWAKRLESIGLRETIIERLLSAMAAASLTDQEQASKALTTAFDHISKTLESPIQTAVIPAAGGQHRLLAPHVIQRLLIASIAEAAASGITHIVLILAPGSTEPLYSPLEAALDLTIVPCVKISCCQQIRPEGLGAAIAEAEELVGGKPFAVLLPDDVVRERTDRAFTRELRRMIEAWMQLTDGCLIAVTSVPRTKMPASGVVRFARRPKLAHVHPLSQIVEKPDYTDPICSARQTAGIVGRYLLQPEVFKVLRDLMQKAKGRRRIELTEALEILRRRGLPIYGYEITARRQNVGEAVDKAEKLIES